MTNLQLLMKRLVVRYLVAAVCMANVLGQDTNPEFLSDTSVGVCQIEGKATENSSKNVEKKC